MMGSSHRWLGRSAIILGIVNGGLGFHTAGIFGSANVPRWSVIVYATVAGLTFSSYVLITLYVLSRRRRANVKAPATSQAATSR